MNIPHYRFLNLHISIWIKYFIATSMLLLVILALLGYSLWIIPLTLVIAIIIIYLLKSGSVSIAYGLKTSKIVIRDAHKSITLQSPVQAAIWWNYTFKSQSEGIVDLNDGSGAMPARADDINVMLELKDRNGKKVAFIEKIVFDFRFPNEAIYSLEQIDKEVPQFKVQRVDKLKEFLENQIVESV